MPFLTQDSIAETATLLNISARDAALLEGLAVEALIKGFNMDNKLQAQAHTMVNFLADHASERDLTVSRAMFQ